MGHDDLDKNTKSDSLKETQVLSKPATLETDSVLVGRFKIQSLQGCGRFGCVYKATDLQLDSDVAIKVLHAHLVSDDSLRVFKNEILTLRQLSHPNIVRVHEYYEDDNTHFITMDWIQGDTLKDCIEQHKVKEETLNGFIEQILSALEVTESKGISHKDLKPDNILIDSDDHLYIADFGIASAVGDQASAVITGTPLYSPPEYLESGKAAASIDIYAFGLILYELITKELPYQAQTQAELIKEKLQSQNIKLEKAFSQYEKVVQHCIAPLADSRPKTVLEVRQLIKSSSDKSPKRNSTVTAIGVATVVLVLVAAGIYLFRGDKSIVSEQSIVAQQEGLQSLAVLPFDTKSTEAWLTDGLPHLLSDELSQISELRIVGYERSRETMDLLGYQTPLDQQKLKVISDLTQSSYLLNTKLVPVGPSQYQVNAELIRVAGNTVETSDIIQFQSSKEGLAQEFSSLVTAVNNQFGLESLDTESYLPQGISLEAISDVEALLQKGEGGRAKEQLEILLETEPEYSKGWLLLGQLEASKGNVLEAESALQKAMETSPENSLVRKQTQAELQLLAGDIDAAIETYRSILQQLPNNSDTRLGLAQLLIEQQSLETAKQELITVVENDENHPIAWYELSKVAIWQGETQEAVDNYLVKALVTAKKLKNTQLQGDVLNAFGVAHHRLGQLDLALDYYQQGLTAREKMDDKRGVVTSLSNLASVYAVKGEYHKAEESLLKALETNETRNDAIKQADLFNELGVIAEEQGLYSKALEHFQASLSIRMKLDDDWLKAESLNNVAYIFFLLSDEEQATIYWEQAKAYYEKVDDPVGVVRVNENMAQLELQKGNWQSAYRMYQSALEKSEELNLTEETIVSKAYLAKIAFIQGNFEQPPLQLSDIKAELKQRQDVRGQVEFSLWLTDWYISTGAYQQAESMLTELTPLMEQEKNRSQQLIYNTLDSRLSLYRGEETETTAEQKFEQVTSKAALESLVHQLEILLFNNAANKENTGDEFVEVSQKFDQYDLDLHRYYLLRKLILLGFFHAQKGDDESLKTVLDQLVMLKRGVGTYWRNYQIERLESIYYGMIKNSEKANDSALKALKSFTELKQQLSEQQQQHLISLQGRYFSDGQPQVDLFMEQINDKE